MADYESPLAINLNTGEIGPLGNNTCTCDGIGDNNQCNWYGQGSNCFIVGGSKGGRLSLGKRRSLSLLKISKDSSIIPTAG